MASNIEVLELWNKTWSVVQLTALCYESSVKAACGFKWNIQVIK